MYGRTGLRAGKTFREHWENEMKRVLIVAWLLLLSFGSAVAQNKQAGAAAAPPLEAKERALWERFKNKDKAGLGALLDEGFRVFDEGTSAFGDKKTEVNLVDEFEVLSFTLSDFTVTSLGPDSAMVTYIAQYEGKSGGEVSKAKSVFAEVWVRKGGEWKDFYMQETYVK
jgi:hypothetical protein